MAEFEAGAGAEARPYRGSFGGSDELRSVF